jgi:hypothetical protein
VSVIGGAVLTKTPDIPVCFEWFYYEASRAGEAMGKGSKKNVGIPSAAF